MRWPARLRNPFRRADAEIDAELRDHLDREVEYNLRLGMAPEEARRAAVRSLGSIALYREQCRDVRGGRILENLARDFRLAARSLRRAPFFSLAVIAILAAGIGANTAIFTVVNAVLLRPLPFPRPERLVQIWEARPAKGYERNVVNPLNFLAWRARTRSFEDMAAVQGLDANLTGSGEPAALRAAQVSPGYFRILGVVPALGRAFVADDGLPGKDSGVILSYGLWQSRFGGDPSIAGRKLILNGALHTVIGVMPRGFMLPKYHPEIWFPLPSQPRPWFKDGRYLTVIARLRDGVSLAQARDDLHSVAAQLAAERPDYDRGWTAEVFPMLEDLTQGMRKPLFALLGAVGLVLLIACANVANLFLMRSTGRTHEMAVRAALGAGRRRLLEQMLAESALVATIAGVAGVGIAYGGVRALVAMMPRDSALPRLESVHIDGAVLLFALALSILTVALFGLVPSLRASELAPQEALQQGQARIGGSAGGWLRRSLVAGEVALSLVLLAGAGLMLRSFERLISVDPGFTTQHILSLAMFASPADYGDDAKRSRYYSQILDEIRGVPGVTAAGSTHFLPLQGRTSRSCFTRVEDGEPIASSSPSADFLVVSPGYFEAMETPLLEGRRFGERDGFGQPSAIVVNRSFARKFFPDRDPIGRRLNLCWTVKSPAEIVGVVADARQTELNKPPKPTIFVDNVQAPMYFAQLVVRAAGDPAGVIHDVEAAIHRVDPQQAISHVATMDEVFAESVAEPRLDLALLLVFGAIAAVLAMAGVYSVAAYSVEQRRREIGIRVALGAASRDISRQILRESLATGAIGIAFGLAGAFALTRLLRTLLFEVKPNDPATLACAAALLLVVVIFATLLPARHAARIDPMIALRYE